MSTAPQGWQNPKTNWQAADIVHPSDFNRIEGNIQAIESGSRTLDPSQVPSGNSGSLRQILSWFANRIRAITGATNWYDAPATTLAAAKSHIDATSGIHGATSSATANRIIIRDSAGRAKVAAPSASDDIARLAEVQAVQQSLTNHTNATSVHGATSSATANRLVIRDSAGRAQFATPSAAEDAATKGYVDGNFPRIRAIYSVTFDGTIEIEGGGFIEKEVLIPYSLTNVRFGVIHTLPPGSLITSPLNNLEVTVGRRLKGSAVNPQLALVVRLWNRGGGRFSTTASITIYLMIIQFP